ncbi:MAG: hypothetical protein WC564_02225 [Patescibacteria group bacterium]
MKLGNPNSLIRNNDISKEVDKIQQDFLLGLKEIQNRRDAKIAAILQKSSDSNLSNAIAAIKKMI